MFKHLLHLKDWNSEEIKEVIQKAIDIKKNPEKYYDVLKNRTLVMLFQKTSTRTRLSFETAMTQLGGHAIFLDWRTTQFMIADFIDEIRATMRFCDILMYRPLKHSSLLEAERVARIPIINALCEKYHPCQGLGDALTMVEKSGGSINDLEGKKIVWLGIANNVSNSLVEACTKLGAEITLCIAEKDHNSYNEELEAAAKATGLYRETNDLGCLEEADFVHTDTWINIEFFDKDGKVVPEFSEELERRKRKFILYQLSKKLLDQYNCQAKLMHCMPCHIGYEITRDAIDHQNSIILDQAENRLHIQKAIILYLLSFNNL